LIFLKNDLIKRILQVAYFLVSKNVLKTS